MVLSEKRFKAIRKQLDDLGYQQPISVESGLLVEQLLSDLILHKESEEECKRKKLNLIKELESLKLSFQPCKELNEKLINENNELRRKLLQLQEKSNSLASELKSRNSYLENVKTDLDFANNEYLCKIGKLQRDLFDRDKQILELQGFGVEETQKPKRPVKGKCADQEKKLYLCTSRSNIRRPVISSNQPPEKSASKKLKIEQSDVDDLMESYKHEIHKRDAEIRELRKELDQKMPSTSLCTVCRTLLDNPCLSDCCQQLEHKLEDSQYKQHEAMLRAVCLAEHINKLEKETARGKQTYDDAEKKYDYFNELQLLKNQLKTCITKIKDLEKSSCEMQRSNKALTLEKDGIEIILSKLVEEKEKLKSQISELSLQVLNYKHPVTKECKTASKVEESGGKQLEDCINEPGQDNSSIKSHQEKCHSVKTQVNLHQDCVLQNEVLEQIKSERNYYYHEYCKLKNRISGFVAHNDICHSECPHAQLEQLLALINHKKDSKETATMEEELETVKNRCYQLEEIKSNLEEKLRKFQNMKLPSVKCPDVTSEFMCLKSGCATAGAVSSSSRQLLSCNENRLANEKKTLELMLEQNERTLRNAQDSKCILESELSNALGQIHTLKNEKTILDKKIVILEQEKVANKEAMMKLDQEKDNILFKLDLKTERNSQLERELREQEVSVRKMNNTITKLEENVMRLEESQKCNEDNLKLLTEQINRLKLENSSLRQKNDGLTWENRQLQDNLSCRTHEVEKFVTALENSKREVEDLKCKLQSYVAEVQHVEELLQKKESERDNLLDHFRSLTIEASVLETNNNSLENEAKTAKDVLKRSEDKIHKLEGLVNEKDNLMGRMEIQVDDLSRKVLSLESKISELLNQNMSYQFDLNATRELCSSLENQKQELITRLHKVGGSHLRNSSTI